MAERVPLCNEDSGVNVINAYVAMTREQMNLS